MIFLIVLMYMYAIICLKSFCRNDMLVHGPAGVLLPPRGNFLDHNITVPTCLRVRKMHVGTRIKGAFGDYGLSYQTASNRQKIRISSFKQL